MNVHKLIGKEVTTLNKRTHAIILEIDEKNVKIKFKDSENEDILPIDIFRNQWRPVGYIEPEKPKKAPVTKTVSKVTTPKFPKHDFTFFIQDICNFVIGLGCTINKTTSYIAPQILGVNISEIYTHKDNVEIRFCERSLSPENIQLCLDVKPKNWNWKNNCIFRYGTSDTTEQAKQIFDQVYKYWSNENVDKTRKQGFSINKKES